MHFFRLNFLICIFLGSTSLVWAVPASLHNIDQTELNRVKALLDVPEDKISFAYSKLVVDQMIDPSINIFKEMRRLKDMIKPITALNLETSMQKKNALREYLYDAGAWNDFKPFRYDFNDPKGTKLKNKLLSTYMDTRKGNCISMPFLFIALGQMLGLDVGASTAPLHVFVKYTNDATGMTYNLETTSGAHPSRDVWLKQEFAITDAAIQKGGYLAKLTNKETVAVIANTLLQHYDEQKRYGQLIATADLLLAYYPKYINTLIYRAKASQSLLIAHEIWRYQHSDQAPPHKRKIFSHFLKQMNVSENRARQLGWLPHTPQDNADYVKMVSNAAKQYQ